ncbi:MAG: hypothetical protein SGJ00_15250 [bacterium]|nr:hypothetical protein [bacterium]
MVKRNIQVAKNKLLKKFVILFVILTLNANVFGQTKSIPNKIIQYTNYISLAVAKNNKGEIEEASKYFKLANNITPIHYFDLMYVRNLLKKKFDKELFLICVREEYIQNAFSTTLNDTSFSNKIFQKKMK